MGYPLLIIAIALCIISSNDALGQNRKRYEAQKREEQRQSLQRQPESVIDIPKITLLFPGFSYEKAIGKFQTLHMYALYNLYSYSRRSNGTTISKNYFDPTFILNYRYYCNYNRRQDLGKNTERNTMNYVGAIAQVFFSKIPVSSDFYEYENRRPVFIFGALYGLQRNFKSRFSLDLNFGLGVITGKTRFYDPISRTVKVGSQSQATIPGQITLGFWLGK